MIAGRQKRLLDSYEVALEDLDRGIRKLQRLYPVAYVFLTRGGAFEAIELGLYGEPPGWSGPYCSPRPETGIVEGPDFEGNGEGVRVRVFGDLITMGWFTYYWRPDFKRFDAILTTD